MKKMVFYKGFVSIIPSDVLDIEIKIGGITIAAVTILWEKDYRSFQLCLFNFWMYLGLGSRSLNTDESFANFAVGLNPDDNEYYLIDHPDMEEQ